MTRILIVDDHAVVRRGLKDLLADDLVAVEVGDAADGRTARTSLAQSDWDLILLDINLPDCNGLDLLAEIHRDHPKLPVVVLSAYAEEEFALHAFQNGASAYLSKQRAAEELITAVQRVLAGGRYVTSSLAELMVDHFNQRSPGEAHHQLSTREIQVLRMIAEGLTQKDIAGRLSLSVKTVATYRARIAEKMKLHSNVELTRYAIHHHLVD